MEGWYFLWDGESHGPATTAEVVEIIRRNRLMSLPLWREGMTDWMLASDMADFNAYYPPRLRPAVELQNPINPAGGNRTSSVPLSNLPPPISARPSQQSAELGSRGDPGPRSPEQSASFVQRHFAKIESALRASKLAKEAGIAGFIFGGMELLGLFVRLGQAGPGSSDEQVGLLIAMFVFVPLIAFLSWRVMGGKGYISAAILLLLFSLELVVKALEQIDALTRHQTRSAGVVFWIPFYFFLAVALFNGIRACWYLKHNRPTE